MGPLSAQSPFQGLHIFKMASCMPPSTSLSKDLQNPPQVPGPPLCPRVMEAKLPRFSWLLSKLLTQVNQPHLGIWLKYRERSHTGGPLKTPPPGHMRCSCSIFCCTMNGPHCQVGTHSLINFHHQRHRLTVRDAGFFRATEFLL